MPVEFSSRPAIAIQSPVAGAERGRRADEMIDRDSQGTHPNDDPADKPIPARIVERAADRAHSVEGLPIALCREDRSFRFRRTRRKGGRRNAGEGA